MKKILLFVLLLTTHSTWAQAAPTVDAVASAEGGIGGGTNDDATYNHPIAADANFIFVCVSERNTAVTGFTNTATVTVGGASATKVTGGAAQSADGGVRVSLFYKASPATGTQSIVVVGDSGTDRMTVESISLKGVDTGSPFNTVSTAVSNGSTNADVDALASATGELAVLCGVSGSAAGSPSPDATSPVSTEQVDITHTDPTSMHGFIYTEAGAPTSINMRVDLAASIRWAASAVSVRGLSSSALFGPFRRRLP